MAEVHLELLRRRQIARLSSFGDDGRSTKLLFSFSFVKFIADADLFQFRYRLSDFRFHTQCGLL